MWILLVEDEKQLANSLKRGLEEEGYVVEVQHDGEEAELQGLVNDYDMVVLDWRLPHRDGKEILERWRKEDRNFPVLMLTALGDLDHKVSGLDAGADDYLTKPFEMDELEARLRAMARRKNLEFAARDAIGPLVFDRTNRQLLEGEQPLAFPRKELATLECLLERRGRIVSKSQLITHVYGTGAAQEDSAIEPHVSRLRKRLEPFGIRIKAARGLGYMLEVDSA